ncbi:MAG: hypothetical protein JWN86_3726 [Planctomycetota bacterium]|nr:hypothetical protein [Planctomycetota bacterium]
MTASVQQLLETFDRLSEPERLEAAAEILRRSSEPECSPLDDETLNRIAEESFREYDRREAASAQG